MTRAAIYARISEDQEGAGAGVARQVEDCRAEAAKRGWDVAEVYVDNDVSATRSKFRAEYSRMMKDIHAGKVDALVVYDPDRLTRTPREAEDILDLYDSRRFKFANVSGDFNIDTDTGKLFFRMKATMSRYETDQTRKRLRRANDQRAQAGRAAPSIGYGYERADGVVRIVPEEARVIRDMVDRILAGEALRSIASDYNDRGVAPPSQRKSRRHLEAGKPLQVWNATKVRQTVRRASLAGLRVHRGVTLTDDAGEPVRGQWEPIITRDQHERLAAMFNDPVRRINYAGRAPKYLLTGLLICGLCGDRLKRFPGRLTTTKSGGTKRQPPAYACPGCTRIRRKQEPLDEFITEIVLQRLEQPDAVQLFVTGDPSAAQSIRDELAGVESRLSNAADEFADGNITMQQLTRISSRLNARRDELSVALRETMPAAIPEGITGAQARESWARLNIEQRRTIIDMLLVVTVLPIGPGNARTFDPSKIVVEWKTGGSDSI